MTPPIHRFEHDWYRHTAVVIGNGLSALDIPRADLERPWVKTLCTNGGYKTFPDTDVLMCTDRRWLSEHQGELPTGYHGPMIVVTRPEVVKEWDPRMVLLRRKPIETSMHEDIFARRDTLVEGWTSTTSMIATAVLRGARRIILVGVDLASGEDGRRRIYDESVERSQVLMRQRYGRQIRHITMQSQWVKRKGIMVLNASKPSNLKCYPSVRWDDLKWPEPS
jgi:hypothetical protein